MDAAPAEGVVAEIEQSLLRSAQAEVFWARPRLLAASVALEEEVPAELIIFAGRDLHHGEAPIPTS